MTPAEHYAEAEKLLAESEAMRIDAAGKSEGRAALMAAADIFLQEAQVHATLATVPSFPEKWVTANAEPGTECTCPHLPSQPKALVGTDAACPFHGEPT